MPQFIMGIAKVEVKGGRMLIRFEYPLVQRDSLLIVRFVKSVKSNQRTKGSIGVARISKSFIQGGDHFACLLVVLFHLHP